MLRLRSQTPSRVEAPFDTESQNAHAGARVVVSVNRKPCALDQKKARGEFPDQDQWPHVALAYQQDADLNLRWHCGRKRFMHTMQLHQLAAPGTAMRSIFPANAESRLKLEFFGSSKGHYFVEVGANQPRALSQTWEFEQRGWTGVLIEPQPDLADQLRRERSAQVFAVACSSRASSGSRMTLHLAGPHSSFDSKLNLAEVKPHGSISVPLLCLDEILLAAGASGIDFMSIDVEGHELEVLDGFDLPRWRPRLLLIEDLLLNLRLHRYLTGRSYRWVRRTGINNWYVPADTPLQLGLQGRWQFFKKFYLGTPFRRWRKAYRRRHTVPHVLT